MGATYEAAEFIANVDDLSKREGVTTAVEQALIDSLGVALYASTIPMAEGLIRGFDEPGSYRVIGRKERLTATAATMVNGSLIHAEDWDDMGGCGGHPSAALFPPLLAIAEKTHASGREFIDAYAVGYQVGTVVGRNVISDTQGLDRPWHATGVVGPIAAAAAASRLLRLSAKQTANAIGIAASFCGGVQAQFGTHAKALHLGRSAMAGYMSAMFAKQGITGDTEVFEHVKGYGACFAPGAAWRFTQHDLEGPLFVTSRHVKNTVGFGIAAKPYPWCGGVISGVTAIEEIQKRGPIPLADIEELMIEETRDRTKGPCFRSPYTGVGMHGKFSLPYNLAARLLFDKVSPHVHSDEAAKKVLDSGLLPKIKVVVQPFADAKPPVSRVTIRLKGGRTLVGETFHHRRETEADALAAKFRDAASPVMDHKAADSVLDKLRNLRELKDAGSLLAIANREA